MRVTGVQAEPGPRGGTRRVDGIPEPGDRIEGPGHRVVAARRVLDQQWEREFGPLEDLLPVGKAFRRVSRRGHVAAVHDEGLRPD